MLLIKMILFLFYGFFSVLAYANFIPTSVPFTGFTLPPMRELRVAYSFGNFGVIFCHDNTLATVGSISWPLGTATLGAHLPQFLKINAKYTGIFANPSGFISIVNTTRINLIVSCELFGVRN